MLIECFVLSVSCVCVLSMYVILHVYVYVVFKSSLRAYDNLCCTVLVLPTVNKAYLGNSSVTVIVQAFVLMFFLYINAFSVILCLIVSFTNYAKSLPLSSFRALILT